MENVEKPWTWYVLTLRSGKDLAIQSQMEPKDLDQGIPETMIGKCATLVAFIDKGDSFALKLNCFLQSQEGGRVWISKDLILMAYAPDADLIAALNKRWGKQSLFTPTMADVEDVTKGKAKFELEKGGK